MNDGSDKAQLPNQQKNCRQQKLWEIGDVCQAPCSHDHLFYDARIEKIFIDRRGSRKACVSFEGYGTEDEEEVLLENLKVSTKPKRRNSSGLKTARSQMHPSDQEMRKEKRDVSKIFNEDMEDDFRERSTLKPPWRTTSRRLLDKSSPCPSNGKDKRNPAASGSTAKTTPIEKHSEQTSIAESVRRMRRELSLNTSDEEISLENGAITHSGFDDADLERPHFAHQGSSPKVALVLSANGEQPLVAVPRTINQYLWEYQREGIKFLYNHYKQGTGAILGDDMGLGKTVQVIGFLAALLGKTGTKEDILRQRPLFIRQMSGDPIDMEAERGKKKVYLIIGPASVLYNWVDELETWGHFTIGKYHKNNKNQTLMDLKCNKLDVVVTTFETCRDNIHELNRFEWDAVIADEAHKIKGLKAEITQALKSLRCQRRYGLTGTALQNDMKELWCILDWANPGCLGKVSHFEEKFERVILRGQRQDATKRQLAEARKAKWRFADLRKQWFLRRTKALIADQLPNKEERVIYCKPTAVQSDVYQAILTHPHIQMILTQNNPCPCHSGRTRGKCHYKKSEDGRTINQLLFSYLHLLMKTSNHIALLMPERTGNENQRKQAEEICGLAFAQHPQFREQTRTASFRTLSDPKYCGKMKVMAGLLKVFKKEKSKVLLFSLSTQLLDIIEQYIITTSYEYRRLDGKTPEVRRQQLVHEFNKDRNLFLFLASTRAGGIGLNLTGANVVIIFDPNWNPTHDLQAQDRAYRLGQGRDVRVYRLITVGTIEENIYLRQVFKQQLDCVATSEENAKRLFYQREIFGIENMFKFRTGGSCLTMDILERNEKIESSLRGFNIAKFISPAASDDKEDDSEPYTGETSNDEEDDDDDDDDDDGDDGDDDDDDDESSSETYIEPSMAGRRKKRRRQSYPIDDQYGLGYVCSQEAPDCTDIADDPSSSELDLDPSDSDGPTLRPRVTLKKRSCRQAVVSSDDSNDPDSDMRHEDRSSPRPSTSKKTQVVKCSKRKTTVDTKRATFSNTDSDSYARPSEKITKKCGKSYRSKIKRSRHSRPISGSSPSEDEANNKRRQYIKTKTNVSSTQDMSSSLMPTMDSVSDVFNQCGVLHVHENRKLIGTSRAEDHMSRCAIQDVYELHQYSQQPAANCNPYTESSSRSEDISPEKKSHKKSLGKKKSSPSPKGKVQSSEGPCTVTVRGRKVLIGQTPPGIRRKHFTNLASSMGQDTLILARRVLLSPPDTVRAVLRRFYTSTDPDLEEVFTELEKAEGTGRSTSHQTCNKKTAAHSNASKSVKRGRPRPQRRRSAAAPKGCQYSCNTDSDSNCQQEQAEPEPSSSRPRQSKKGSSSKRPQEEGEQEADVGTSRDEKTKTKCPTNSAMQVHEEPSDGALGTHGKSSHRQTHKQCKEGETMRQPVEASLRSHSTNINDLLDQIMDGPQPSCGSDHPTHSQRTATKTAEKLMSSDKDQRVTSLSPSKQGNCTENQTVSFLDSIFFDDGVIGSPSKQTAKRAAARCGRSVGEESSHTQLSPKAAKNRLRTDPLAADFDIFEFSGKVKSQWKKRKPLDTKCQDDDTACQDNDIFTHNPKWVKKTKKSPLLRNVGTANTESEQLPVGESPKVDNK